MPSVILPTIIYLVFALSVVVFTTNFGINNTSEVYSAAISRFLVTPWKRNPDKTIKDVAGGIDVYQWLMQVFINLLYLEHPQRGDWSAYCSEVFKCGMNDGDVEDDADCSKYLRAGNNNCPSYMGGGKDCCAPCIGSHCANFTISTPQVTRQMSTSVPDVSANCDVELPAWLDELNSWKAEPGILPPKIEGNPEVKFCPERLDQVSVDIADPSARDKRFLTIAQYNRVLMARISLKRIKLVKNTAISFVNAYPKQMASRKTFASFHMPQRENMDSFGQAHVYEYQHHRGFRRAGAFVEYLLLEGDIETTLHQVAMLEKNYWFDLNQGSFVLDMIVFNGNVEKFLYVAFIFEHRSSGLTDVQVLTNTLDLFSWKNPQDRIYHVCLYSVIVVLYLVFVKKDFDAISNDYKAYLSNFNNILQMISLSLCGCCLIFYLTIVTQYPFQNFQFPMPSDHIQRISSFEKLVTLTDDMSVFMTLMTFNLLLMFVRCITVMQNLVPSFSLVFTSIETQKWTLLAFLVIFLLSLVAFTFCSHYLFGARVQAYSSIQNAFLNSVCMIMRQSNYRVIEQAGSALGLPFFLIFHITFIIIMQLLCSVMLYGYIHAKEEAGMQDANLFQRIISFMKLFLKDYSSVLGKCSQLLQQLVGGRGGGDSGRVNIEKVNHLKDNRRTKPVSRTVMYEVRPDLAQQVDAADDPDYSDPSVDVSLRAVTPFYPEGLMHYFVDKVKDDGPACDSGIQGGKSFRLVAIHLPDRGITDRLEFRKISTYEDYGKNANKILDNIKDQNVTLEFEGKIAPISKDCIGLLIYIAVFIFFAISVNRTYDSQDATAIHLDALQEKEWYEYNPKRVLNFDDIDNVEAISSWANEVVLERAYGCVTNIGVSTSCALSTLTETTRKDWVFWAGASGNQYSNVIYKPLKFQPVAATGLSMGYIPFNLSQPITGSVKQASTIRMRSYNFGVMPHNFMRLTLQLACFERNQNPRWAAGFPYKIASPFRNRQCSTSSCMEQMIGSASVCYQNDGEPSNPKNFTGKSTGVRYAFSKNGTFGNFGGMSFGLGSSRKEAAFVLYLISNDQVMQASLVSTVFEYATYNANLGLLVYAYVSFDVKDTGKIERSIFTSTFPINPFSTGPDRVGFWFSVNLSMFILYLICLFTFTLRLLWDLHVQYSITSEMLQNQLLFWWAFFTEDWWNFIDVASIIFNYQVAHKVFSILYYQPSDLRGLKWPLVYTWTMNSYELISENINLGTADQFDNLFRVASMYSEFSALCAANGFFMLLRLMKYFTPIIPLRLMLRTLSSVLGDLFVIGCIIGFLLGGFVCSFHNEFGIQIERYGTFTRTFFNLFVYLVGVFQIEDMQRQSPVFTLVMFTTYVILFFLLTNILLAAIVYGWRETRRDAMEFSLLSTYNTLSAAVRPERKARQTIDNNSEKIGSAFWQSMAILPRITQLDQKGKYVQKGRDGEYHEMGSEPEHSDSDDDAEGDRKDPAVESLTTEDRAINVKRRVAIGRKKVQSIFKQAHMEIASQWCQRLPDEDEGGGVGDLEVHDEHLEDAGLHPNGKSHSEMIGIIELALPGSTIKLIQTRLKAKLIDSEELMEEVWLDALVTVLEHSKALAHLQKFFLKPPTIWPKKPQEWGRFNDEKSRMEKRLDYFLKWLQAETRKKYFQYLRECAYDRERALKQQGLVLHDYMEKLNQQISIVEVEIRTLEQKNNEMRTCVAPLL